MPAYYKTAQSPAVSKALKPLCPKLGIWSTTAGLRIVSAGLL